MCRLDCYEVVTYNNCSDGLKWGYVDDEETGLYYLRSRYYNSYINRFLNVDQLMGNVAPVAHNLYTYCSNSTTTLVDPNGTEPQVESNNVPFSDALNVFIAGTSMRIVCYVNISGNIDPDLVEQGIEKYWNRDDLVVNGAPFSLSCDIVQGKSPNGHAINIYTFNDEADKGITHAPCVFNDIAWASGYINIVLRRYYADGRRKDDDLLQWSVAHEFAHVLGISDYYLEHPGTNFSSITNAVGMPVSADDVQMVMEATKQQTWMIWP